MQLRKLLRVASPTLLLCLSLCLSTAAHVEGDIEETYYFLNNHLGSVDVILDKQGNVVERSDYLPYGEDRLRIQSETDSNPIRNQSDPKGHTVRHPETERCGLQSSGYFGESEEKLSSIL